MDLKRMQFAWVRGARIQHKHVEDHEWRTLPRSTVPVYEDWDRIHPDDEHLQYGPLSTAMRNAGIYGAEGLSALTSDALSVYHNIADVRHVTYWKEDCDGQDRNTVGQMHALFIAEFLADEGL